MPSPHPPPQCITESVAVIQEGEDTTQGYGNNDVDWSVFLFSVPVISCPRLQSYRHALDDTQGTRKCYHVPKSLCRILKRFASHQDCFPRPHGMLWSKNG
ncbi:hypothetical protein E2C01_048149 [Portunus trituberculatus]|uniref:Uncharacterized protein n=1 Tax=Portunus trituberculatus TaxID=210409 RepID=A0A5B7G9F0_PORTR|nr:hypothetical protein [Portunus trituberculatus]